MSPSLQDLARLISEYAPRQVPRLYASTAARIARLALNQFEQGETPARALISAINSCQLGGELSLLHGGLLPLVEAFRQWLINGGVLELAGGEEFERWRAVVEEAVFDLFEPTYGGLYGGDWRDVDTNDYDIEPALFLEEIAVKFGVPMPPYGTNRELVDFVLTYWWPRTEKLH